MEVFEYPGDATTPDLPSCFGFAEQRPAAHSDPSVQGVGGGKGEVHAERFDQAELEKRLAEERRRALEEGRQRGVQEGRNLEREAQAAALAGAEEKRARQAAQLIESFRIERDHFLQVAEPEVVKLALAVAARILRREAQMDPLLLTGAVRVALGQLAGSTEVRLKVPAAELDLWSEAIALLPNLALKPTVVAGDGMRLGDCEVETRMGTVDLGIRSQLAEIERGFFDRAGGPKQDPSAGLDDSAKGNRA